MDVDWSALAAHARAHHGTITWRAAHDLGISAATLATWRRQGRVVRVAPEVYVVAGSAPTWMQRVAVATGSTSGWASHRTAAALHGLDGFPPRVVEVVTPHGRRRRRGDWLVHESRRLRGVDLDEVGGTPCTSLVRTVLDLPAVAHPFLVARALDHACRRRQGTLELVAQRFLELTGRGRAGSRLMRAMLDERLGRGRFTQSGFEASAVRMVRSVGLPEPTLQHQVSDGPFVVYLDLAWPPIRFAAECNSLAFHSGKGPHEWDHQRRRLRQLGWELVEVTYDDVTRRRVETAEQIRSLYSAREAAVAASGGAEDAHRASAPPEKRSQLSR